MRTAQQSQETQVRLVPDRWQSGWMSTTLVVVPVSIALMRGGLRRVLSNAIAMTAAPETVSVASGQADPELLWTARWRRAMPTIRKVCSTLVAAALMATATGCSNDVDKPSATPSQSTPSESSPVIIDASVGDVNGLVNVGGRSLYVRCTGTGSPTLILEGGDEDTSSSYSFAEADLAAVTRTCVYDRANLGRSDPDPGPRGLAELVADFEGVLRAANIPGPYVLVGTSGGGYISAGYAVEHPRQVAGMVFVEVPAPFWNPPAQIVADTRWDSPVNIENRDYLQVEKDAWAARTRIGNIPVTVMSNRYSADEIAAAQDPSERQGMRTNVSGQRGWLVLSPSAKQVVVHTGHAIEERDPELVLDSILEVVRSARS